MDIGKRLISLRKKKGKTATEIAKVLNLSQSGYSRYENNKSDIPLQYLFKILEHLELSPADFFEYDSPKYTSKEIELIENYRSLSEYDQAVINTMATMLKSRPNKK